MSTRPRTASALIIAAVIALVVACCPSCEKSLAPDLRRSLDGDLGQVMDQCHVPGAVVGSWAEGEGSWRKAAGLSDLDSRVKMNTEDSFRIGSVTKSFTATMVLQLVDEGKFEPRR